MKRSSKFAGIVACAVAFFVPVASSSASAYSCTGYGIAIKGYGLAQFCAQTSGSGVYVQSFGAGFSSPVGWAGIVCNSRVKAEFINSRGQVYASYLSNQQNGCSTVGAWKWTINRNMQAGTLRYTLLSNGASIAAVQHRIG